MQISYLFIPTPALLLFLGAFVGTRTAINRKPHERVAMGRQVLLCASHVLVYAAVSMAMAMR